MLLTIQTIEGRNVEVEATPSTTIGQLRESVAKDLKVPVSQPILLQDQCIKLDDDKKTIADYEIDAASTLSLLLKLIKIKTLTGKEIELDIEPSATTNKIKEQLEEKEGIPPAQQRLIYMGKAMNDDKTCAESKVEAGATIHLILSLRGGRS